MKRGSHMLAIQYIKMYWEKENRTPEGSVMRKEYYFPAEIHPSVVLEDEKSEYFLQKRLYIQKDRIYTNTEYNKEFGNRYINSYGPTDSKEQEEKRKFLLEQNKLEKENLGLFYSDVNQIEIPGIEIIKEDEKYRIRWYSLEHGYQPVRKGYNETYSLNNAKCFGKRIKCETAFVLEKQEAGKVTYNYRYTSYHGQHYEQYCIYFVHTDKITHDLFVNTKYGKEYVEMADLF